MTTVADEPGPAPGPSGPGAGPEGPMASVAGAFLDALAVQDFGRLASACTEDVHLRALLPGGLHEWHGPAKLEAAFTRWFGDTEAFEVVDADIDVIGSRLCLRWRVRLEAERLGPGRRVVEQEAYADLDGERLSALSLLCSGYLVEAADD